MTSKTENKITGRRAEDLAWDHLKKKKYKLLEQNYTTKLGEIDMIVQYGEEIIFVEVKGRRSEEWGDPFEAVNSHKQKKIIQVALQFIKKKKHEDKDYRFDVISIVFSDENTFKIEHFEDAFDASVASYLF